MLLIINTNASAVVCHHHHRYHDEKLNWTGPRAELIVPSQAVGCSAVCLPSDRASRRRQQTSKETLNSRCPRQVAHRTRYFALISISVTTRRPGFHVLLSPIAIAILGRGLSGALLTLAGANPHDSFLARKSISHGKPEPRSACLV